MITKRKYTVSSPPRVHEIARACGMTSSQTRDFLYLYNYEVYRTPSHKVPLRVALDFLTWLRFG
jgi:hypothetical protein